MYVTSAMKKRKCKWCLNYSEYKSSNCEVTGERFDGINSVDLVRRLPEKEVGTPGLFDEANW